MGKNELFGSKKISSKIINVKRFPLVGRKKGFFCLLTTLLAASSSSIPPCAKTLLFVLAITSNQTWSTGPDSKETRTSPLCHKSSFNPCCNVPGFFFLKTSYVSLIYKCRIVLKIFTSPLFELYPTPERGNI